jgi:FtsZ-binding cell division protein ZapB
MESIIKQYQTYEELLRHSEQIPLQEFQAMNADEMPRFAEGLFDEPPGPGLRRKRKKLADFTNDEKQARRKLKNRIAAQSARDRKRIETEMQCKSLDNLQAEVERLRNENISLRSDNQLLRDDNAKLRNENNQLRAERTVKIERDLDRLHYQQGQRHSSASPNSLMAC